MKKIRVVALLVVFVMMSSFLTACKKDQTLTTVEDVKGHYGTIAEIALASQFVTENSVGYEQEKEQFKILLEQGEESLGEVYQNFVSQVVSQAQIKDKYIKNYLDAVKDYVQARANLSLSAKSIYEEYKAKYTQLSDVVNKNALQQTQMQNYLKVSSVCNSLYQTFKPTYSGVLSVLVTIAKAPFDASEVKKLVYGQVALSSVKELWEGEEYSSLTKQLKSLYEQGGNLINTFDVSAYVKILINLVLNEQFLQGLIDKLEQELANSEYFYFVNEQVGLVLEVAKTLKNDFSLGNENKKLAYANIVSTILNNEIEYSIGAVYEIDYDKVVVGAELYNQGQDDLLYSAYMVETLKDLGKAFYNSALTDGQVEGLVEDAKILDKNGLGYFAEKYVPMYAYLQEFVGQILMSLEEDDFGALSKIMLLGEQEYNANKEQLILLGLTLFSKVISTAYNEWDNAGEFVDAWANAIGENYRSIITGTVTQLTNIAKYCPADSLAALENILQGNKQFNLTQVGEIEQEVVLLAFIWKMSDFVVEDTQKAYEELKTYLSPMISLMQGVVGENMDKLEGYIPSLESLYELFEQTLNQLI